MKHILLPFCFVFISFLLSSSVCQSNSFIVHEKNMDYISSADLPLDSAVLNWDNGWIGSFGWGENSTAIVAARFPDTLTNLYSGYFLKHIQIAINDLPYSVILKVFNEGTDTTAGTLIYSQDVSNLITPYSWNLFDVNPPIPITGNDIWIGYEVGMTETQLVIGIDNGPVHPDGDWIGSLFGSTYYWYRLSNFGFNNNLVIRGILDDIVPVELLQFTASTDRGKVILNWITTTETNNHGFEIERKIIVNSKEGSWVTIGFKDGHGTTTENQTYRYIDDISEIQVTSLNYRLKQIDYDGSYSYSNIVFIENPAPVDFALLQNYPNPFNPTTRIQYRVANSSKVILKVYNTLGNEVATLVNEEKPAGVYSIELDASNLTSGVYFYTLDAGSYTQTRKLVLLK